MAEIQQILPLRLYNIDNQIIPILSVSNSYTYFIRSYRNFSIKVLAGKCTIYSVTLDIVNDIPTPIVNEAQEFVNDKQNTSYTLLLESDAIIECDDIVYQIKLLLDNEITEENQHYPDLLYNYDLPTFEELEPAILDGSKRELIKRLLLDFRSIISRKGTILSIEKFFNFLGLNSEYLHVWEEYLHENKDGIITKTIQPNKETDYKSGDYHVLFDNWDEPVNDKGYKELDEHNLPIRKINIQDFDAFFKALVHAIALADRYFTLQEQDISFFGIGFSANLPKYFGITGNMSEIWEQDVYNFRKKLSINIRNFFNQNNFDYIVKNTLQYKRDIYRTEIKIYTEEETVIEKDLYWIIREFYDDEEIPADYDIRKIKRCFGKVLQIDLNCRNCYYEIFIENTLNPLISIKKDKTFSVIDNEHLEFVTATNGEYRITIDIYDKFNNRERFVYYYELSYDILHMDFETFNSVKILDKPNNGLTQDIESPGIILLPENIYQYIIPITDIPDDLTKYYNSENAKIPNLRYLRVNERYELLETNQNILLDGFSETLITKFVDNWLDIYAIKLDDTLKNKKLVLRIFDANDCKWKFINYDEILYYKETFDNLFVTIMDVIENHEDLTQEKVPYVFITTTETSLDIKKIFDFCFIEPIGNYTQENIPTFPNIYELDEDYLTYTRIPVNYDFQLFTRKSKFAPDFNYYVSHKQPHDEPQVILGPVIESVFPRLINIEKAGDIQVFYLKLGDIITCRCNDNYLVNYVNVVWKIYNSFTNELIYETNDLTLKYRIDENTCYDIELEYIIEGLTHKIRKKSLFSSFDVVL